MKALKNPIFMFILGIIVSSSIAYAVTKINAEDVSYDSTYSVKDKIDDLYTKVNPEISSNYFGINHYNGREALMETNTSLNKGKHLCTATFSLTTSGVSSDYLLSQSSGISIAGCDKTNTKKEYTSQVTSDNTRFTAGNVEHHFINQVKQVTFECDINGDNTTVTASLSTTANVATPAQIAINCTLIK